MESVREDLATITRTNQDIQALLKSVTVILTLAELRLKQASTSESPSTKMYFENLSSDIAKLHGACHALLELTLGLIENGRNAIHRVSAILADANIPATLASEAATLCHSSLKDLTAAMATISAVKKFLNETHEVLEHTAANCSAPDEIRTEVGRLFQRLRNGKI
jgi:hypothetical protein